MLPGRPFGELSSAHPTPSSFERGVVGFGPSVSRRLPLRELLGLEVLQCLWPKGADGGDAPSGQMGGRIMCAVVEVMPRELRWVTDPPCNS